MRSKDEQKIEAIHQATLKLNQQVGFGGMTMAKIAREAGIATGTLYIYFKNKEELINSLYLHLKRKKARNLLNGMDMDQPLKPMMKQMFVRMLQSTVEEAYEMAFLEQYYRSPFIEEAVQTEAMQLFEPFFEVIERGQKEYLIKEVDRELIMAFLSGVIHEFSGMVQEKKVVMNDQTINTMFNMLWDGIKA